MGSSSPLAFFQHVLGGTTSALDDLQRSRDPEFQRKQRVLRQLDDLKIQGQTLANEHSQSQIQAQAQQLRAQQLKDAQVRAGLGASADSGKELVGPPNPDPLGAEQEQARMHTPEVDPNSLGLPPEEAPLAQTLARSSEEQAREARVDKGLGRRKAVADIAYTEARPGVEADKLENRLLVEELRNLRPRGNGAGSGVDERWWNTPGPYLDIETGQQVTITRRQRADNPDRYRPAGAASERDTIQRMEDELRDLAVIKAQYRPEYVGPGARQFYESKQSIPGIASWTADPQRSQFYQNTARLLTITVRNITGAQMNQDETPRIARTIPGDGDTAKVWVAKFAVTQKLNRLAADVRIGRLTPQQANAQMSAILDQAVGRDGSKVLPGGPSEVFPGAPGAGGAGVPGAPNPAPSASLSGRPLKPNQRETPNGIIEQDPTTGKWHRVIGG